MTSPTQRSLALLRKNWYTAQVVERWNPYAHVRVDLFKCIDIVAIRVGERGVTAIQATSDGNISKRLAKSVVIPELKLWLETGNRFFIWGFGKKGKRGERKIWKLRAIEVKLSDLL